MVSPFRRGISLPSSVTTASPVRRYQCSDPPSVALEAEALPRIDDDPLDLVVSLVGQDRVVSPGTVIRFHHACLQQSEFS